MSSASVRVGSGSRFFNRAIMRFIARRLVQAVIVMLMVMSANFVLIKLAPGDIVDVMSGSSDMTSEQLVVLRQQYGLDQPVIVQFTKYFVRLAQLDLGYSNQFHDTVLNIIMGRLPTTLLLVAFSVVLSTVIGTIMGVAAARSAGSVLDSAISALVLMFYATPVFVVAIALILCFSVWLGWFPTSGLYTIGAGYTGWAYVKDVAGHLVMPVVALCTFYTAIYARLARATMLEVMHLDFVRTARAKGLSERRVIYRHALRNALLPIVTMVGLQVSSLIGGAVLIETVFGLPGMGRTAFDAIFTRDTNLLLGVMFIASLAVVCVSLVVDFLYALLDPRVELK